jgi:hypothetical protein
MRGRDRTRGGDSDNAAVWRVRVRHGSGQELTSFGAGTYAGQFVMSGFVDLTMPMWLRNLVSRGLAIVPSLAVAIIAGPAGANDLVCPNHVPACRRQGRPL